MRVARKHHQNRTPSGSHGADGGSASEIGWNPPTPTRSTQSLLTESCHSLPVPLSMTSFRNRQIAWAEWAATRQSATQPQSVPVSLFRSHPALTQPPARTRSHRLPPPGLGQWWRLWRGGGRCAGLASPSVSQLFHGPAPRSPLHRLASPLSRWQFSRFAAANANTRASRSTNNSVSIETAHTVTEDPQLRTDSLRERRRTLAGLFAFEARALRALKRALKGDAPDGDARWEGNGEGAALDALSWELDLMLRSGSSIWELDPGAIWELDLLR